MATKPTAFRFSETVLEHLDFLCKVTGNTRVAMLSAWIEAEYDRYQGNPELQKLIAQMKTMETQMKSLLGQYEETDTFETPRKRLSSPPVGACVDCVNPCKDECDPTEIGICDRFKAKK